MRYGTRHLPVWLKDSYQVFHRLQLNDLHIFNITGIPALLNLLEPLGLLLPYLTHLVQNLPRCVLNSYIFYLCHIPFCLFTALLRCKDTNYFQFCIKIASLFTFFLQFLCQTSLFPPLKTQKRSTSGRFALQRTQIAWALLSEEEEDEVNFDVAVGQNLMWQLAFLPSPLPMLT